MARDGDGDGFVHDNTPMQRPVGPQDIVQMLPQTTLDNPPVPPRKEVGRTDAIRRTVSLKYPYAYDSEKGQQVSNRDGYIGGPEGMPLGPSEPYPGVEVSGSEWTSIMSVAHRWIKGDWTEIRSLLSPEKWKRRSFSDAERIKKRDLGALLEVLRRSPVSTVHRGMMLDDESFAAITTVGGEWDEALSTATGRPNLAMLFAYNAFGTARDPKVRHPVVVHYKAKNVPIYNREDTARTSMVWHSDERFISGKFRVVEVYDDGMDDFGLEDPVVVTHIVVEQIGDYDLSLDAPSDGAALEGAAL